MHRCFRRFIETLEGFAVAQGPERLAEQAVILTADTATTQANRVQAVMLHRMPIREAVRQHVSSNFAGHADHRVRPDPAELMHADARAEGHEITDDHMARHLHAIRDDDVIADETIVRDMHVNHEQVVAADPGQAATARRASVDRHELLEDVAITNLEVRDFALVLHVHRFSTEHRVRPEMIVAAYRGVALDDRSRLEDGARPNVDLIFDDAVWANVHARLEDGVWVDDRAGVDGRGSGNAHARDSNPGSEKFQAKIGRKAKAQAKTGLEPVGICGLLIVQIILWAST